MDIVSCEQLSAREVATYAFRDFVSTPPSEG